MTEREFHFSWKRKLTFIVAGVICLALGVACVYVGFGDGSIEVSRRTHSQARTFAFLALPAGAFLLFNGLKPRQLLARITSEGIQLTDGSQTEECLWEDVEVVWETCVDGSSGTLYPLIATVPLGTNRVFTLERPNAPPLRLTGLLERISELGVAICEATLPTLVDKAKGQLASNGVVEFGPIKVTTNALVVEGKDPVEFATIWKTERRGGHLLIQTDASKTKWLNPYWAIVPVEPIPNLHVLLSLLNEYRAIN